MPPRPFPFPFSVGVDACRSTRILKILEDGDRFNQWARKVFTRLEWPSIYRRVKMTYERTQGLTSSEVTSESKLSLPNVSEQIPSRADDQSNSHIVSPLITSLAQFLSGRWAAKEAAIKAHRYRKLYLGDISIVPPVMPPGTMFEPSPNPGPKPFLLIDPVPQYVLMDPQVAVSRGLRGFSSETPDGAMPGGSSQTVSGQLVDGNFISGRGPGTKEFVLRKRLVKMEDRQMAELSISHDGPYVIAVCMAVDEEVNGSESPLYLADGGSGDAVHEPIWGDRGWLPESLHEQEDTVNPNSSLSGSQPTRGSPSKSPSINEIFASIG